MTANVGRAIALKWDGAPVPGVRERGLSMAGAPVDITSDDDAGWRTLLEVAGQNEVTISVSGVTKSDVLRTAWLSGNRTKPVEVVYPDGGVLAGTFYLSSYNETGPYNDAITFEAEVMSSGEVTYTAGL